MVGLPITQAISVIDNKQVLFSGDGVHSSCILPFLGNGHLRYHGDCMEITDLHGSRDERHI